MKTKNKSSRYPFIDLEEAISIVVNARKFGKAVTDAQLAGNQSIKSGSFIRKKASLGYYGLIEGNKENMTISNLAEKIISPLGEEEKKISIRDAFLKPQLFRSIYDTVQSELPIELDYLGNMSTRTWGVQPKAKNHFLRVFTKSGLYAGIIEYISGDESRIKFIKNHTEENNGIQGKIGNNLITETKKSQEIRELFDEKDDVQTVTLSLSGGMGNITVPSSGLDQADIKKLIAQIYVFENVSNEEESPSGNGT